MEDDLSQDRTLRFMSNRKGGTGRTQTEGVLIGTLCRSVRPAPRPARVLLESCIPGRERFEAFGATLCGHPKGIMFRMEAFRMAFSEGKHGWAPLIH